LGVRLIMLFEQAVVVFCRLGGFVSLIPHKAAVVCRQTLAIKTEQIIVT